MQTPIMSAKDSRINTSERNFGSYDHLYRYLTIKVHEAKLLVNVAFLGGKMETYARVTFQNQIWKTSIDKLSHQTPKWNEVSLPSFSTKLIFFV